MSSRDASALHFERSGAAGAPVLLLGSSLGTTLEMWQPALAALTAAHEVIAYDHRGHGGSPLPEGRCEVADLGGDVLALLDRLELGCVDYAGVSLGGMVGLWLAANAADRIGRLVCICSSAHLPPAQAWAQRAEAVREAGSVGAVAEAVLARWFTPPYAAAHPEVIGWMDGMLRACPADGYAACCGVIEVLDLRADLARIAAPTLAIGAAADPAIPPEHSTAIAAGVPGARVEILAHGAHLAVIERVDEVTDLIERHLEAAQ